MKIRKMCDLIIVNRAVKNRTEDKLKKNERFKYILSENTRPCRDSNPDLSVVVKCVLREIPKSTDARNELMLKSSSISFTLKKKL